MRHWCLARGLIGILVVAAPMAAFATGNIELKEVEYASWLKPKFGDRLPIGGPVIRVYSENGDRFKSIGHADEPVRFLGLLSGSCGEGDEISSLEFEIAGQKVSLSLADGQGAWFSRIGVVELSRAEPQGFHAVRECNDRLKTLAARTGRTRRELVAEGFGIRFRNWIGGRATLTCGGRRDSVSETARLDTWVQCGGHPAADEPIAADGASASDLLPFGTDLTFAVDHPSYVGKCPVGLQFAGSITTSRAGYVTYRSIGDDGSVSPAETLKFNSAGAQTITAWKETFSESNPSAPPTAGPKNGGASHTGWRRLEIVDPKGFAPSSSAEYSITCLE